MQEQAARVVEYVLAMVGRVHHCGNGSGRTQLLYDAMQDVVGLQNGVVVGVDELRTVSGFCLGGRVGHKPGTRLGVAVAIVEVRSVHVQHHKQLLMTLCHRLAEERQQSLVARLSHYIVSFAVSGGCFGVVISLTYEQMFVRLAAQKVDIRVVGLLV